MAACSGMPQALHRGARGGPARQAGCAPHARWAGPDQRAAAPPTQPPSSCTTPCPPLSSTRSAPAPLKRRAWHAPVGHPPRGDALAAAAARSGWVADALKEQIDSCRSVPELLALLACHHPVPAAAAAAATAAAQVPRPAAAAQPLAPAHVVHLSARMARLCARGGAPPHAAALRPLYAAVAAASPALAPSQLSTCMWALARLGACLPAAPSRSSSPGRAADGGRAWDGDDAVGAGGNDAFAPLGSPWEDAELAGVLWSELVKEGRRPSAGLPASHTAQPSEAEAAEALSSLLPGRGHAPRLLFSDVPPNGARREGSAASPRAAVAAVMQQLLSRLLAPPALEAARPRDLVQALYAHAKLGLTPCLPRRGARHAGDGGAGRGSLSGGADGHTGGGGDAEGPMGALLRALWPRLGAMSAQDFSLCAWSLGTLRLRASDAGEGQTDGLVF